MIALRIPQGAHHTPLGDLRTRRRAVPITGEAANGKGRDTPQQSPEVALFLGQIKLQVSTETDNLYVAVTPHFFFFWDLLTT